MRVRWAIGSTCSVVLFCTLTAAVTGRGAPGQAPSEGTAKAKTLENPIKSTPESIAAGKQTFGRYCAPCHGPEGKGDGQGAGGARPANLVDEKWQHGSTDGEIFTNIRDGIGPFFDMASWQSVLKEPDIWNVINYLRSIGPPPPSTP
jgi:mono/diheme cytochrome c family protein